MAHARSPLRRSAPANPRGGIPAAPRRHLKGSSSTKHLYAQADGKVAIVTGASKGIGASIAKHLADAGAAVVVNYLRAAGLEASDCRKQVEAQTPLGRIGPPQDIGPAAVFLASSDSAWITGETLAITGGLR